MMSCKGPSGVRIRGAVWTLASLTVLFGAAMLVTALVALWDHGGRAAVFALTGLIVATGGALVAWLTGPAPDHLGHREGFLIVTAAWMLLSLIGATPFWLLGVCHGFVDGVFEAASGLTTTGATVLSGLDRLPPSILFWRSMLQWLGGIGVIVLVVAVMPFLGAGGMQLLRAEVPGPVKDKLTTRVSETAKALWALYLGLTAACAVAYGWAGMDWFDAVNHAMSTVSTGGFSTHDASVGWFGSPLVQMLAVVFMFIAGVNFALHFAAMRRGVSLRLYLMDEEFQFWLAGLAFVVVLVGFALAALGERDWEAAVFTVVSIATTTGFTVSDYAQWPPGAVALLMMVMLVGGCAGSTSGGMKVVRVLLLLRHARRELLLLVHPRAVMHVKIGHRALTPALSQSLWGFVILYLASFFVVGAMVAFSGVDLVTAFSASAACISNTGPGLGAAGPAHTYASLPDAAKAVLALAMILGRLEVYTFLILLMPQFWRR